MKTFAILALVGLLCVASSGWCGPAPCQGSKEGLFDIVLDVVTAPCALLATCLGLDPCPACTMPTKVKITKVAKKEPSKPNTKALEKKSPPVVSDVAVQERPVPSEQTVSSQPESETHTKTVPMKKFAAPEREVSSQPQGPRVPVKSSVTVSAPETPQTTRQDGKANPQEKQRPAPTTKEYERPTPAIGTIGDATLKPKPQELSPPKVELSSTEKPEKPADVTPKKPETKKKSNKTNYHGYPCGLYYQPYQSCGPRFFFR